MAEELGKIEKPEVESYKGERNLYLVPLLFSSPDVPADYKEMFELYWQQVSQQIENQESKIGRINRIYHESVSTGGEEGLALIEKLSPLGHTIIAEKCKNGAILEASELQELADECMDWERCLFLGFLSRKAAEVVSEHYRESSKQRFQHIAQRIDETLLTGEVAVLFIREGHAVQFADTIKVFSVSPPVLDNIHRWLRDRPGMAQEEEKDTDTGKEEAE